MPAVPSSSRRRQAAFVLAPVLLLAGLLAAGAVFPSVGQILRTLRTPAASSAPEIGAEARQCGQSGSRTLRPELIA